MTRIVFVTGTRAEFGLLTPVLRAAKASATLQTILYATGTHPLASHGTTLNELTATGFPPDRVIEMLLAGDSRVGMAKSIGLGTISLVDALAADQPDAMVILGDRFELMSAALAAMSLGIPIVHLEGGHVTQGAIDDSIRHAVTKLARLHFTSTQVYADRIIQMGEDPGMVHVVGSTGIDNILSAPLMTKAEVEASLGLTLSGQPLIVATHHPVTAAATDGGLGEMHQLLAALDTLPQASVVFTQPNADPGNQGLTRAIADWVAKAPENRLLVSSLGFRRYLSLVAQAGLVLGNSSSGLIEAPALGVPTVNIGQRQKGRIIPPSVITVDGTTQAIRAGIDRALSPAMQATAKRRQHGMGDGTAGARIVRVLETTDFAGLGAKGFCDLPGLVTKAKSS